VLVNYTITEFSKELSSSSPAPGGGSVAALNGVLAASLMVMVCNLTMGREKYKNDEVLFMEIRDKAASLQDAFLKLVDDDTMAFNLVMSAYQLPKNTEDEKMTRLQSIQDATMKATQVPLVTALKSLEALRLAPLIAKKGNTNAISDIGVAVCQAEAALQGAVLNVKINLSMIKDQVFVKTVLNQVTDYQNEGMKLKEETMSIVQAIM